MPVFSQDKIAATIDKEKIPDLDEREVCAKHWLDAVVALIVNPVKSIVLAIARENVCREVM